MQRLCQASPRSGEGLRKIWLDDDCSLRFPGRDAEFCDGVELGILAVLMDQRCPVIERSISPGNVEAAQALARRFGYFARAVPAAEGLSRLTLEITRRRPALRVV